MSARLPTCLLLGAILLGCGSSASTEGGVTGTGISASVTGNVSLVDESAAVAIMLPFPIRVTIAEVPGVESTTDANGTFALRGSFSGALTLQFSVADSRAELGELALEVPAGSETVLENIEIRTAAPPPDRIRPSAVRQFDVFAHVDMIDCAADGTGSFVVVDDGRPPRQFLVRVTAETMIATRDGSTLRCADLQTGDAVQVDGILQRADQTIVAGTVVVVPMRPPPPPPGPRAERVRGVVRAVGCERGLIEVEQRGTDEPVRRIVQLVEGTDILCAGEPPTPCSCADIAVGDPIGVVGLLFPERPGVVVAETIVVDAALRHVAVLAIVASASCAAGLIELRDANAPTVVLHAALSRRTEILCGRQVCACTALRRRQRVRVEGFRDIKRPSLIYAERLIVLPG
jgi:hypothetical protein